jgi:hypothetical protein
MHGSIAAKVRVRARGEREAFADDMADLLGEAHGRVRDERGQREEAQAKRVCRGRKGTLEPPWEICQHFPGWQNECRLPLS